MNKNVVAIICASIGAIALIGAAVIGLIGKNHSDIVIAVPEKSSPPKESPKPESPSDPKTKMPIEWPPDPQRLKDALREADNYFTAQRYGEAADTYKKATKYVLFNSYERSSLEEATYAVETNPEKACMIYQRLFQRFRQPNMR